MKTIAKKYSELNDIQKLKISKVFLYENLDIKKKEVCHIVFSDNKMKYLIVEDKMIDL
jgi:hypothetical protein